MRLPVACSMRRSGKPGMDYMTARTSWLFGTVCPVESQYSYALSPRSSSRYCRVTCARRRLVPPYRSSPATTCSPEATRRSTALRAAMPLQNASARSAPCQANLIVIAQTECWLQSQTVLKPLGQEHADEQDSLGQAACRKCQASAESEKQCAADEAGSDTRAISAEAAPKRDSKLPDRQPRTSSAAICASSCARVGLPERV